MDIILVNKIDNDKTIKPNEDKSFVFVVALKRAVFNGSTKSRFNYFFSFRTKRINCFIHKFLILLL